jgi:IS4 transposase
LKKNHHQGLVLYSKEMYFPQFQRNLKIVVIDHSILCSTDLNLSAQEIFEIYSARFQIEYLFRDGKSHMGLGDAQVRKSCSLNFQNNACLTALNLLKLEHRKHQMRQEVISIFSYKHQRYNQNLIDLVLSKLGKNPKFYKNHEWYIALKNLGSISS